MRYTLQSIILPKSLEQKHFTIVMSVFKKLYFNTSSLIKICFKLFTYS